MGGKRGSIHVNFDEDFMMGSNDRTVMSPIWGLEDVLSGHIFTQGNMLTKMFLDIYMEGVGDNKEQPAIQIARSKIGIRDGQREESWGWGLEVAEDEEGKMVADRVADFDWSRLQAAMVDRLTGGPYHRMEMETVGTVSSVGYKVCLAEWDTKREAAKTQLEKGVDDEEVVGRNLMAWQMPANQLSQATFLQGIKEVMKQDCEGSEGERACTGDEIVKVSLDTARRAPYH